MATVVDFVETAEIKATTLYSGMGQSYRYHDIQDLSQELLVVAWLAIGSYDPSKEASLNTWVNRRMDYYIQDFVREQKNKKIHIEYVGDMWDLHEYVEEYQQAQKIVFDKDLAEVFAALTDKQKTILKYKIEGFTHEEIAEKMGYKDNSAIAHQWKQIVQHIMKTKINDKLSERFSSSVPKNTLQEHYFDEFLKNLPKNKKKTDPQDAE